MVCFVNLQNFYILHSGLRYVQTHTLVGMQNAVCEILVPDHFKIPKAWGKNGRKMGQIFKKMILPKMSNLMIKIDYSKDKTLYYYINERITKFSEIFKMNSSVS